MPKTQHFNFFFRIIFRDIHEQKLFTIIWYCRSQLKNVDSSGFELLIWLRTKSILLWWVIHLIVLFGMRRLSSLFKPWIVLSPARANLPDEPFGPNPKGPKALHFFKQYSWDDCLRTSSFSNKKNSLCYIYIYIYIYMVGHVFWSVSKITHADWLLKSDIMLCSNMLFNPDRNGHKVSFSVNVWHPRNLRKKCFLSRHPHWRIPHDSRVLPKTTSVTGACRPGVILPEQFLKFWFKINGYCISPNHR